MRYIYLLKDPISKEVVYVGETSKPKQRYNQHVWGIVGDSEEKKSWVKNLKAIGLKPLFEIIDTADSKRAAILKENDNIVALLKKGIKLFNTNNSRTLKQYDLFGKLIREYADRKLALEISGIIPRPERHTSGGYQWSYGDFSPGLFLQKEASKKVLCKPVLQIDKSGNIIKEFEGVRIAHKETGIDHRSISQVAAGSQIRKTAGGFIWKYKNEEV